MTETKPRKRAPGGGRKSLPPSEKKRRIELHVNPSVAAYLEAEDQPKGLERSRIARRRKQEAAELLRQAKMESKFI